MEKASLLQRRVLMSDLVFLCKRCVERGSGQEHDLPPCFYMVAAVFLQSIFSNMFILRTTWMCCCFHVGKP